MKAVIEQKFGVTRSRDATSSGQPHPTPEQFAQKVIRVLEGQRETPLVTIEDDCAVFREQLVDPAELGRWSLEFDSATAAKVKNTTPPS